MRNVPLLAIVLAVGACFLLINEELPQAIAQGDFCPDPDNDDPGSGGATWRGGPSPGQGGGLGTAPLAGSTGKAGTYPLVGLVDPGGGSVLASSLDLAIASKGAPVVQWRHLRTYDQSATTGPGDTVQGQNWFNNNLQDLTLESGGEATADKDVTWRYGAHRSYTFANSGSYTFSANDSTLAVLSHEATGDPADTYRVAFLDGTIIVFWDFDYATTAVRGKLNYIEDVYGNQLSVSYDGSGKIDYITDPSGHYFRYTYLSSGANSGKLDYIRVFKSSGTADADLIARIEFTYMETGHETYDGGNGTTGDLIKVLVKTHKTNETGTTFGITKVTHYLRYFKDADTNGNDHQIKMILLPEHYQRADDNLTNDPLVETDANVDDYATWQFKYDGSDRCKEIIAAAAGCGGCGGGGGPDSGTYTITYATQTNSDRNDWAVRCKVTHNGWTRYIDLNNWGEVYIDTLFTTDDSNTVPVWVVEYTRDSSTGQVTSFVTSGAITDYDVTNHTLTYDNDGSVNDFTYDANAKRMASMRIRKKSETGSAAKYLGLWEYVASPAGYGYRSRYLLDKSYTYPSETTTSTDSSRLTTDFDYFYHADSGDDDGDTNTTEDSDRVIVIETTYPTVTTAQNGPNSAATEFTYFDTTGRQRWYKDGEENVHYYSFHDLSGAPTYTVRDVYTSTTEGAIRPTGITSPDQDNSVDIWADWTGAAPKSGTDYDFQNSGSAGDYVQQETKRLMDLQGRVRRTTDASGEDTYFAYLDGETRTYSIWNVTTDKPLLPVRRVLTDEGGRTEELIQVDPSSITFSDPPTGAEDLSGQSNWVSWSKTTYDSNLLKSTVKAYHTIPSSGAGSDGTNYYTTTWTYASDATNKVTTVQVEDPEDGYTKTTYNPRRQRTKVEGTATESGGSPTSWKTLTEWFYDQATPGSGASKGGNGNLTQVKSYYADAGSNSTSFTYDWRERRALTTPPTAPFTLTKLDNKGRAVAVGTFSSAPAASADPTTTTLNRLSLNEISFNNRDQVYETKRWEIKALGTKGDDLITDTYYDRNGRTVATVAPGGGARTSETDGAGRLIEQQTCVDLGSTLYSSGAFDYTSDNKVVELTQLKYDASDNRVTETHRYQLEAGSNSYINPDSIGTNVVPSYQFSFYDDGGRRTQSTNFGTNSGGLDGPMNGSGSAPTYTAASPESRSDTNLVSTWTYASDGRLEKVADPDNVVTKTEYDDLGRRTATIEDWDSGDSLLNRKTKFEYNGNSDITKLSAHEVADYGFGGAGPDDQVTQYVYGHAVNSRWVTEIRYPGSNGQASSASADKVVFTYNHDGTVATRADQNASTITYDYDTLRRKTHELVSAGSGVDTAVLQLVTTYSSSGGIEKLTSRDSATKDAGNVVNEVKFTYDGLGQLTKDEQEHDGAVDGSTLSVQYAYDISPSSSSNRSRLDFKTYPNARTMYAKYTVSNAASVKQDEISDEFGRISQFADADGSPGDVYSESSFAGLSRRVGRNSDSATNFKGNDTNLTQDGGTADEYDGLDQFGRLISQLLVDSNDTGVVRSDADYEANRDGSPKFAEEQSDVVLGRSSLYSNDNLGRLTQADDGRLNSGRTDIVTEWSDPQQIVYTMDILGNMTSIDHKNSGTSANQTRVHNATNELTSRTITAHSPVEWINDPFTDNDTTQWTVANLVAGGDGTWSAASGQLQNDTVVAISGSPGAGNGSMLLADIGAHQTFELSVSVELSSTAENGGLVFGYVDKNNYWLLLANRTADDYELWQVSSGTFTKRRNGGSVSAGTHALSCEVRSGRLEQMPGGMNYTATIPAGQVGVWAGSGSASVKFDDFVALSLNSMVDIDGRWWDDVGGTSLVSGKLEFSSADDVEQHAIRRGFRGSKYVFEYDHPTAANNANGVILHYQGPGDFVAVVLDTGASQTTPKLVRRYNGDFGVLATGTAFTMTSGDRVRVAIHDDPLNSALQEVEVFVAGTSRFTSSAVDDRWSAGRAGCIVLSGSGSALGFDNVKIGLDNNSDDDVGDAGDTILIDDDFASNVISLTYDNNGNLTDDGIFKFVYDAWNRLRETQLDADGDTTDIATYEYYPDNRRSEKIVQNLGDEETPNDGGNTTIRFYYDNQWRIFETRNGSNQATFQYVRGTQYTDELILIDRNGDPTIDDDCNPDNTTAAESTNEESPADARYFVHQDRNWNVTAISAYGGGNDGRIVERYSYTPYGSFVVLAGDSGNGELGSASRFSSIGNVFAHQGLPMDQEKRSYHRRRLEYSTTLQRPTQRSSTDQRRNPNRYVPNGSGNQVDPTSRAGGGDVGCRIIWQWDFVPLPPTGTGHIGLQWQDSSNTAWKGSLDYGWRRIEPRYCRSNLKAPASDRPAWIQDFVSTRPCFCQCFTEQFRKTHEQRMRYGTCCGYNIYGWGFCWGINTAYGVEFGSCSNSNGAINAAAKVCERECGEPLPRPWFGNDLMAYGWSNSNLSFRSNNNCRN